MWCTKTSPSQPPLLPGLRGCPDFGVTSPGSTDGLYRHSTQRQPWRRPPQGPRTSGPRAFTPPPAPPHTGGRRLGTEADEVNLPQPVANRQSPNQSGRGSEGPRPSCFLPPDRRWVIPLGLPASLRCRISATSSARSRGACRTPSPRPRTRCAAASRTVSTPSMLPLPYLARTSPAPGGRGRGPQARVSLHLPI